MKNLGKQDIEFRNVHDGVLKSTKTIKRNVYSKADGSLWVSYAGGHRQVQRDASGNIIWTFNISTLRAVTPNQLVSNILNRLGKS